MNSGFQFDVHPNTNSLAAFVERVLPRPERQKILAHIADCNRCREIIHQAQDAAIVLEPNTPQRTPSSASLFPAPSWFMGRSVGWVLAPALFATFALILAISPRHSAHIPRLPETASSLQQSRLESPVPELRATPSMPSTTRHAPARRAAARTPSTGSQALPESIPADTATSIPPDAVAVPVPQPSLSTIATTAHPSRASHFFAGHAAFSKPPAPSMEATHVSIGETPDQVVASIGDPGKIVIFENKRIYLYPDLKITFVDERASALAALPKD